MALKGLPCRLSACDNSACGKDRAYRESKFLFLAAAAQTTEGQQQ